MYTKGRLTKTKWLSVIKRKGRDLLKSRDILTSSLFLTMTCLAKKPFIVKGESDEKISMLFAAAIFLYGAPNVYAETEIRPGMSVDEIKAVLEEHGISLAPSDSPADIAEDAATPSTNVDQSQASYIIRDDSNPVKTTGPCTLPPSPSFSVTGADMGNIMGPFPVTANTSWSSTDTAMWMALPFPLNNAGVAIGNGWMLFEQGDTWNNNWWIITTGVTVYSIEIDAWNKTGGSNKHAVFDIITGPEVTPDSANGRSFTRVCHQLTITY